MSISQVQEQETEEKERTVSDKPKLQLITGGKGPPENENWLGKLVQGDVFIARHKGAKLDNPILEIFEILDMYEDGKYGYLAANVHMAQQSMQMYVDTLIFSRQYNFGTLIGKVLDNGGTESTAE